MRWETEAHAAAFEAATPGAVITCAVGTLEAPRRRMQDGEVDPATRRCMWCGAASCAGSSPGGKCPAAAPVLRCGRCEWADAHTPGHVDDFHDADDVQKDSPGECDAWIVFDMAFDRDMNAAEHGALSRQVSMCVAANRRARRPFRLAAISTNEEDDAAVNPNDPNDESVESRSKSPFVVDDADVANPAMGPNAWRRLPWTRWGARCGGPKTWQTFDASASGVPHSGCGGYFGYDQGRGRVGVGRTRGPQGEAGDGVGPRRGLWRRAGAVEDREAALGWARPAPEERAPAVFGRVPTLAFGAAAYSSRRPGRRGAERRVGPQRRIGDEESRRERAPRETEEGRGRGRGCGVRTRGRRVASWRVER